MRNKLLRLFKLFLIFLIVGVLVLIGVNIIKKKKKRLMAEKEPAVMPLSVHTAIIKHGSLYKSKRYLGTIKPQIKGVLSSKITAYIDKVYTAEGDLVQKGQLLAQLDDREIKAKLSALYSQLKAANTALTTYKQIYQRDLELFKNEAISKEALQRSDTNFRNAEAKVKEVESSIISTKAQLTYSRIYAPYNGIITSKYCNVGDLAVTGKPLFEIESVKHGYRVVLPVPQSLFPQLSVNTKVLISPLLYDNKNKPPLKATISRLYPGNIPNCEIYISDRPFDLPTGSKLYVEIKLEKVTGYLVPDRSILEQVTRPSIIFLVEKDHTLKKIPIKILASSQGVTCFIPLTHPLKEGQRVVVAGEDILLRLHDGQKIKEYPFNNEKVL